MARRADHSREELYEIAMQAAERIVETDGFRALTARNVADAIGYSAGTLYNLFANLDELVLRLNGRTLDALHDGLAANTCAGAPERRLAALLDGYLSFVETHPGLWRALFEHSLPDGIPAPDWYTRKVDRVLGLLEGALAPLFPDGDNDGRANAARILWAGLHGICSLSDSGKLQVVTAQPVRIMAEGLVRNFVAGLRVHQEEN